MKCVSVLVMAFALTAGLGEDSEASRQIQVDRGVWNSFFLGTPQCVITFLRLVGNDARLSL